MEEDTISHEQMINVMINKHFGENPISIERIWIGICNEVYNVKLSNNEVIARLSDTSNFIKGSHYHIPLLKEEWLIVPDILAEDYSKKHFPLAYQFLSKLKGKDIFLVIDKLSDNQLKSIAWEVSLILDKTKTISSNWKFGLNFWDFTDFSDSWAERMDLWTKDIIKNWTGAGVMDEEMKTVLVNLLSKFRSYFEQVNPTAYLSDISSKNIMIDNGKFTWVVDVDGFTQGDPLEAIGRIKASWAGTHHWEVYTNAIIDKQCLNYQQINMVTSYAIMNRISWTCDNGIQFNQNTNTVINEKKLIDDKKIINILLEESRNYNTK